MRATSRPAREHPYARGLAVAVAAIALLAALGSPHPAMAADQNVQVGDNVFTLPAVAVKPGEKVTWTYPVGAGVDIHNVHFEDELFESSLEPMPAPWTSSRTFDVPPGPRPYYCEEHGNPGGQGMTGVVYVNEAGTITAGVAPTASFTVSNATSTVGEIVTFDASASSDPEDPALEYEWDLDGNGTLETNTGAIPRATSQYTVPGTRNIKLRVNDDQHLINETTRMLVVNAAPSASFTASPSTARTGQAVTFNAAASSDPDGTIARYEWDLDGNGTYETDTGASGTTTRSYATAGARTIGLRVTDNAGGTSVTTRSVQISAPPPPVAQPVIPAVPAPVSCSSLSGAKRAACMQKACATLKGSKRASCIQRSCRYLKGTSRARCVLKSCRYLKRKSQRACKLKSCRYLKGSKKKACVRKYRRR